MDVQRVASYSPMYCTRIDLEGETRLRIVGVLDALTVREIKRTFDSVVAERPRRVTVDFHELTMIDSTGVGAIVSLFKRVKAGFGQVVVVGARDQPLAVLKLLKLDRPLGIVV